MNTSFSDTATISALDGSRIRINPLRLMDNARSLMRLVQRLIGAALVLAALALWALPGASWASDLLLFKLAFSLAMGFSGLALWQMGTASRQVEIELDTETYEVRVIMNVMGRSIDIMQCRFNDLQRVEIEKNILRLWDGGGNFLAEVDMVRPEVKDRLMRALKNTNLLEA